MRPEGTVVVAIPAQIQTLNPLTVTQNRSIQVQREIVFEPLLRYDDSLTPVPGLASFDTTALGADSLLLTFRIRPDARWHDGRPVTAADVATTLAFMRDSATAFPFASELQPYARRIELLDPLTVRMRLLRHAEPLEIWYQTPIAPAHVLRSIEPARLRTSGFGTDSVTGSGPFRLVGHDSDAWTFEADTTRAAPPRLWRLVLRVVPDATTALTELLTGGVHVLLDVPPENIDRLQRDSAIRVLRYPRPEWTFIAWNQRVPFFGDVRVRRALDSAIARDVLVQRVLLGLGTPGHATVTPAHPSFDAGAGRSSIRDLDGARALLAEAGYSDRDGDGIVEDSAGRPFRFTLITNGDNTMRRGAAEMVQSHLRDIGVAMEIETLEFTTLAARIGGSPGADGRRERNFDAVLIGWNDAIGKSDEPLVHSSSRELPNGFAGHASRRIDALLDTLASSGDPARRDRLWREYQAAVRAEVPLSVLFYPDGVSAVRREVEGVEMDRRGAFVTVTRWSITR